MSRFLSMRFADIEPYVPGEQPQGMQYIKLNTNESPFPPAPGVLDTLSRSEIERLNLYPDPDTRAASDAVAQHFGLRAENVLLGNGSDELLSFCFQAFCDEQTPPCFADITYGFYKVFARIFCLNACIIPLNEALEIVPEHFCDRPGTKFIANPNAPTGHALPLEDIERILAGNPNDVVVVDEAYVDFGASSARALLPRYENLLIVQTMSKSRNLAGARLGYALGSSGLIADLQKMKFSFNPYNVNRLSLLAGTAAMKDDAYFQACTQAIKQTRAFTCEQLSARDFTVLPSCANFVFAKPNCMPGAAYYEGLKAKGVLVRYFNAPRIYDYVRITIGTNEQMQVLLDATDELWRQV